MLNQSTQQKNNLNKETTKHINTFLSVSCGGSWFVGCVCVGVVVCGVCV